METLKYIIEDNQIAELLGVQNFSKKESAVLELVKNSFDAGATELKILFKENQLILEDNGIGLNEDNIRNSWMHVGKSDKKEKYNFKDIAGNEKIYSGSKGIGRFALARLGGKIELISNKEESCEVIWKTDWIKIEFNIKNKILKKSKTQIIISGLRDKWTEGSIEILKLYLSRTIKNPKMKILIEFKEKTYVVDEFIPKPKLGVNCLSIIKFKYSAQKRQLKCTISSDEFSSESKNYYKGDICFHEKILDFSHEKNIEFQNNLQELGDFEGEFYFHMSISKDDKERFLYKHTKLLDKYANYGITLYRNFFSIASYEGDKDWIGLGERARKSPAAATHPSGAWRVRFNNITGIVEIDKKENNVLKDLSNRQGIEEDGYYEAFLSIIDKSLEVFENYRQEIIRKVNEKNSLKEISKKEILPKVLLNFNKIEKLEKDEKEKLKTEIIELQKSELSFKKNLKEVEDNFKYDIKILNMLSTIGLKAASIAHDLQNERNSIDTMCKDLKSALIRHNVWDVLDKEENKNKAFYNVPKMLEDNEKINKRLSLFIGTLLDDTKKSKFKSNNLKVLEVMEKIKRNWERDYSILNINLVIDSDIKFQSSEDTFKVIFDNLILNTFQQNNSKNKINIKINIKLVDRFLEISYEDDGIGLDKKYIKEPMQILNVHETSRNNGHGLGMWITNNTIIKSLGKIEVIKNIYNKGIDKGFYIFFKLGSEI